jgi:hypothetical protein
MLGISGKAGHHDLNTGDQHVFWRAAAAFVMVILVGATLFAAYSALARDTDGRSANSTLKSWFDQLASNRSLCCSFADDVSIQDIDRDAL